MRIWLDDEREMPAGFDRHVKTATQAFYLLATEGNNIEYISFDNDLGEGKEGRHVADHIEQLAFFGQIRRMGWDVHSANPEGRKAIIKAMTKADIYWGRLRSDTQWASV